MAIVARDVMQQDVITVFPETPLLQIHHLFLEEEINGAPVVSEDGALLGLISSLDLIRAVQEEYETPSQGVSDYLRENLPYSLPDWTHMPQDIQDRLNRLTVNDAMVTDVVTVRADTPIHEVVGLMREQRIHRVPVLEDGELVGLLTTFDLIALLGAHRGARP